ncbi:hypothetical protein [Arenimonas sp. MALMAid1274]|uniref:hypothetical protein n=1 Tax=Arenimonas sp. MALMAid1274 TaxID=3411630 RepID=UPI003BA042A0
MNNLVLFSICLAMTSLPCVANAGAERSRAAETKLELHDFESVEIFAVSVEESRGALNVLVEADDVKRSATISIRSDNFLFIGRLLHAMEHGEPTGCQKMKSLIWRVDLKSGGAVRTFLSDGSQSRSPDGVCRETSITSMDFLDYIQLP